jgi:hypothetical protein
LVKAKGKGWYFNQTTKKMEDKRAWVEMHDGYVFGCGAYKGQQRLHFAECPKSDNARMAQRALLSRCQARSTR